MVEDNQEQGGGAVPLKIDHQQANTAVSTNIKAIFGHTSMGRFGEPSELAGAAVYLASEKAASFVTGSDIVVDGGFLSQTI